MNILELIGITILVFTIFILVFIIIGLLSIELIELGRSSYVLGEKIRRCVNDKLVNIKKKNRTHKTKKM